MQGKELKSPGNKVSTGLDYCKSGSAHTEHEGMTSKPSASAIVEEHLHQCG